MSEYGLLAPVIAQLERWTGDDAVKASEEARLAGRDDMMPLLQWSAWHEDLPELQRRHEQGDQRAIFEAVDMCARCGLPMPPWCRQAYSHSWSKAREYKVRTLDEAFGYEVKGTKLAYARQRYHLAQLVARVVTFEVRKGATGEQAIQATAAKYGVSPSVARDWYYEHRLYVPVSTSPTAKSKKPRKD